MGRVAVIAGLPSRPAKEPSMPRLAHHPRRSTLLLACLLTAAGCDGGDKAKPADEAKAGKADAAKAHEKDDGAKPAGEKDAPAEGRVWFVSPADGAEVPHKFDVEFGVEGKRVEPAGGTTRDAAVGHHHIIIDGAPIDDMQIVPKDERHLHYGDGSTKTTLLLEPGEHKLTMQFADGAHQSYGPDWSATIKVKVLPADAEPAAEPAP
jgi:hypothetical protein